jgi:eukaryotic-like serine/threonine-protein kinase
VSVKDNPRTIVDAPYAATLAGDSEPTQPPAAPLLPGTEIHQYEIIRELGRGGMGQVYLARDTKLGRRVAMKFLAMHSEDTVSRFLIEARATARCNHENIVVIHEVDEHEGRPYMVLEYLDGSPLRTLMEGKKIAASRAVEIMAPVVRALARAHADQIVHRDLKPENIFVTASGAIKVLDFGIAKLFESDDPQHPTGRMTLTAASGISGTLAYMSPEQYGMDAIDHRSDLWAVGIILYEMVAGEHPLDPLTTPQKLIDHATKLDNPMPSLERVVPDVPSKLDRVVARCLAKHKGDRYGSAAELLEDLDSLLPRRSGRALGEDESPYPGLSAFQESDADRFFGRASDVLRLTARLRDHPIVAVVGPSGVGKSSFVRAGVIPALKSSGEPWEVLVMRPGRSPMSSLASAVSQVLLGWSSGSRRGVPDKAGEHETLVERLGTEPGYLGALFRSHAARKGCQVLLFVDQFEELYALVDDPVERYRFTACLAGVADDPAAPLRLLVSMRSDLLDRAGEDVRFMEDLTRGLIFLQPLGRDALHEALTHPVEMLGYAFETREMIDEMVGALEHTAGALPLLQFAAARLWEGRDRQRKILTHASYVAMGGLEGALATHADEVMAALAPPAQRLARTIFQRLVTPDGTRAIVDSAELASLAPRPGEVQALLDHLVGARLLVVQSRGEAEGPAVELVHESLIQSWPALRRWLDEGHEDAALLAQISAAAKQWDSRGRPPGLLWRGEAMIEARQLRARHRGHLGAREAEFLDAVFALADRATRVKRAVVVGTMLFLGLLVAASSVALVTIRRAERAAVLEMERARDAEQKVKDQLAEIEAQKQAKEKLRAVANEASAGLSKSKEELHAANLQLFEALTHAEAAQQAAEKESARAREAATRAEKLALSERQTREKLEKLLAQERARVEKLEKEGKKIMKDLR